VAEEASGAKGATDGKEALHLVVVGHVDAGKSTLMGRVLHALGQVMAFVNSVGAFMVAQW
jgi:elongation factor 1 alpha-like protein